MASLTGRTRTSQERHSAQSRHGRHSGRTNGLRPAGTLGFCLCLLGCGLGFGFGLWPLPLSAAPPFSFQSLTGLKSGQSFSIQNAGKTIGKGQILNLGAHTLAIEFDVKAAAIPISGRVTLQGGRKSARAHTFQLQYQGQAAGKKEAARETVSVPDYLVKKNIISFSYHSGRRFFQLSQNRSGQTTLVTDWGAARLIPLP